MGVGLLEKRILGKTGLEVTPLGLGTAEIGFMGLSQPECDRVLNGALDAGLNVIDTAACYADSEKKIGAAISDRRDDYILVSKCGHHVGKDDPPEWTPEVIRLSAERSLRRLKTDRLDVLLLHSCAKNRLANDDMIAALQKCKTDGLTRFIGYSGDNDAAIAATGMDVFDCMETSVSLCDQQVIDGALQGAKSANLGVFVKRSLANGCWRDLAEYSSMYENYAKVYTDRLGKLGFSPESLGFDGDWIELALRFSVFQEGVHTPVIGGKSLEHIQQNVALVAKGPLPAAVEQGIRDAWKASDDGSWVGQT